MEYALIEKSVLLRLRFKGGETAGKIDFRLKDIMKKMDPAAKLISLYYTNYSCVGKVPSKYYLQLYLPVYIYFPKPIGQENRKEG